MIETKKYIVLKDDIIIRNYHTSQGAKGIEKSLKNENVKYDKIIEIPVDNEDCRNGFHKNEFDKNFKLKKLSERISEGYVQLPEGHKLDNEIIRPMTLQEKVEDGLEEIDPLYKVIGNELILKTEEELITDGIKTQEEIDNEKKELEKEQKIQEKLREIAIKELEKNGEI